MKAKRTPLAADHDHDILVDTTTSRNSLQVPRHGAKEKEGSASLLSS